MSMNLVLDLGNSRCKWALANTGLQPSGALVYGDDFARTLDQAFESLARPTQVAAVSVAGAARTDTLTQWVKRHWSLDLRQFHARATQCGVTNTYDVPAQLGADRWAGLIAAWKFFGNTGRACVVVNAGTTMTVDALSADGVFLGGVIVPGVDLMRASLDAGTAQLRLAQGAFYYFPDNTADAIMSGAINALTGAIERIRGYMEETGQGSPLVVLSGGAAALIQPRLNTSVEWVDNLVLEGLLEIANQQQSQQE